MKYTVTYENGVWSFSVESTDPSSDYCEEFEITDENEAKTVAAELTIEISEAFDDEDLDDIYFGQVPKQ